MPLVRRQLNRARTLIGTIKGRTGNENEHGQGVLLLLLLLLLLLYCLQMEHRGLLKIFLFVLRVDVQGLTPTHEMVYPEIERVETE